MAVRSTFGIALVLALRILGCLIVIAGFTWFVLIGHQFHARLRLPASHSPQPAILLRPVYWDRALFLTFLGGVLLAISLLFGPG